MSSPRLFWEWVVVALASLVLVGVLVVTGATTRLDNTGYDLAMRLRQTAPPDDIIIVAIDDASLRDIGRWPWPRTIHADLISRINRFSPRAIAYDVLFTEPSDAGADATLAAAVAKAPVFLPLLLKIPGLNGEPVSVFQPVGDIGLKARGLGHADADFDEDGIVRRTFLQERDSRGAWPHIMVRVARHLGVPVALSAKRPGPGDRSVWRQDEILIPFGGPPGHIRTVPAASVLRGEVDSSFFKDKVVLVGTTAPGLLDGFPTPASRTGTMSGIEMQANILAGLLQRQSITSAPMWVVLVVSLAVLAGFLVALLRLTPRENLRLGGILTLGTLGLSIEGVVIANVWFPPAALLAGLALTLPVWGWRRLHAASAYFAEELKTLQAEAGTPLSPVREPARFHGDRVQQQMTLLHRTNQQIADLRRFVADVLADLPDAVMVVNPDGQIRLANHSAEALCDRLGVSAQRGASFLDVLSRLEPAEPEGPSLWPPKRFEPLPGMESARGIPVEGPAGLSLEVRFAPAHDSENLATGWIVQMVDVSELVGALRQREEALQLFTHDMRAPQSAILALLERPEFKAAPEDLRDRIARHARRTLTLANGFVQLARAQSSTYSFETVDIAHMLGDAVDELWSASQVAGVTIKLDPGEIEFPIAVDRTLMTRALINLLDNAVKFSSRGGVIRGDLAATALGGAPAVACVISDQGCGMTPDQVVDLFMPFTRHPPSISNREGVGLGLALVHSVVVRHGGQIACRSQVGEGTSFTLTFPLTAEL